MGSHETALYLGGLVALFEACGAKKVDCTIDFFCQTSIYELPGMIVDTKNTMKPRVIWQKGSFRATIIREPADFFQNSTFSPQYAVNSVLRHNIDKALKGFYKKRRDRYDGLFVVMEEYKKIEPVRMRKGECLVVDSGKIGFGPSGEESIIALRTKDGAWPEVDADVTSQNVVLAALKIEQKITYGITPLVQSCYFLESTGKVISIIDSHFHMRLLEFRIPRYLNFEDVENKIASLETSISVLHRHIKEQKIVKLINALRLDDDADKQYLSFWYRRLWDAAVEAGRLIGEPQFGNPQGVGRDERCRQRKHRNDLAHGREGEVDVAILRQLQSDILKLLGNMVRDRNC